MKSIAQKIGRTREALRRWVRQAERDHGNRAGLTSDDQERLKGAVTRAENGLAAAGDPAGSRSPRRAVRRCCRRSRSSCGEVSPKMKSQSSSCPKGRLRARHRHYGAFRYPGIGNTAERVLRRVAVMAVKPDGFVSPVNADEL